MRDWLGRGLIIRRQRGADLGARMANAFRCAFRDGSERVIIIGTDCPALTVRHLAKALDSLRRSRLVLGPTQDGGYYLIGLHRVVPNLFTAMRWGGNEVLEETLRRAARSGVAARLLPVEGDVDRPADLHHWNVIVPGE